MVFN
jgi:TNF receptor-associated protein 1